MGSMDANVTRAIEQANAELYKGSNASSKTVNSLIAILANYAANPKVTDLRLKLEALKKKSLQ